MYEDIPVSYTHLDVYKRQVNMDYRSFELDYECGVMVYGAPMIESLLEDLSLIHI